MELSRENEANAFFGVELTDHERDEFKSQTTFQTARATRSIDELLKDAVQHFDTQQQQQAAKAMNQQIIAAAQSYCNEFSIIAVDGGKKPLTKWTPYQISKPTRADVTQMFTLTGARGIAVIAGRVSGNLEVIDVDCKYDLTGNLWRDFYTRIKEHAAELVRRFVIARTVNNGYHVIYRAANIEGNQKLAARTATADEQSNGDKTKVLIETRGTGGYFVVAPTTGYKFIQGDLMNLPEITADERDLLIAVARSFDQTEPPPICSIPTPTTTNQKTTANHNELSPFDDYYKRADVPALLQKHGWQSVFQHGDRQHFRRPGTTDAATSANFHTGKRTFYVFSTSTEFAANKGYSPSGVYAILEHNGDFSQAAKALIKDGYGTRSNDNDRAEAERPPDNPQTRGQTSAKSFNFSTLDALLDEPDEETAFVWDKTLPVGGFSICSAKPKVGKSTFARNLAVAISRGEPFLGRDTVQGTVLYLCLEEKRAEVKRHFAAMNASGTNILIYTGATPDNALDALAPAIAEHEPVLVVIDPLGRVLRVRDFNDYGAMTRGLEPFVDLSRKLGTHILAVHHDGKGERDGGDALLGSTALFGSVDCHLQMKKRERGRTILTTQRYGEDLPETVIDLDKETGVVTAQGDLQAVTLEDKKREVLAVFETSGEALTEGDIKERIGANSKGIVSKAIRELLAINRLTRSGDGKKGNPYLYSNPAQSEQQAENHKNESEQQGTNFESKSPNENAPDSTKNSRFLGLPYIEKPRNLENLESNRTNAANLENPTNLENLALFGEDIEEF